MRFHEQGPNIPDELLLARDEGNVLFFCGAGVSRAFAGLADFLTLAGSVIDDLGSLTGSHARRLHNAASIKVPSGGKSYVPVDRIFNSLDLEFDPKEVRDSVARALKPKPSVDLQAHQALIDLSRGTDGRPRLITTNFDRLFEACDPNLLSWDPSKLPLPERPSDFEGIIHIHGRVDKDYNEISETVVLSSADFGKAYLSDGWATHYIRRLMSRFKVVFVGYSAEDPPVQYLLEALREEQSPLTNIFAFQYGEETDANEQWVQKGVVPIAFGTEYSNLWKTLKGWAERARDLDNWYQNSINEAFAGPSGSSPVFRGRIAHLASTRIGMNKLLSGAPPLPATWLYVFDPKVRYLRPLPIKRYDFNGEKFNPFDSFGLDRDEAPLPIDPDVHYRDRDVPNAAWNAYKTHENDALDLVIGEVGSFYGQSALPPRLWTLALFLVYRMAEAPTLWWAAGLPSVHPELARGIDNQLKYRLKGDDGLARHWRYLLAFWAERDRNADQESLHIRERAAREGWSPSLMRAAVALSRPFITVQRAFSVAPPMTADANPATFLVLDVEYPTPFEEIDFENADLTFVVSLWRALLVEAEQLENEIGAYISLDTTRADDGQQLGDGGYGLTKPLLRFMYLMQSLEATNQVSARNEVTAWKAHDGLVFQRLRIWAAGRPGLIAIEDAESTFMNLGDSVFWSSDHERDLLFAIKDRWTEMSDETHRSIEARILEGPNPFFPELEGPEARKYDATVRLNILHWLAENGVEFGFDLTVEKTRLLQSAPDWREEFADYTAQPRLGSIRSVIIDENPSSILDVLPSRLLPIDAGERRGRNFTERDPFAGLSAELPARAVLALHSAMRRDIDSCWRYWLTFLKTTSEIATTQRQDSVVVALIKKLMPSEIAKVWYPLLKWLSERTNRFAERNQNEFDVIWDKIIEAAALYPSGYEHKSRRDWGFEALNSVIGRLVMALMNETLPDGQTEVPTAWITRLTKALQLPGDHALHAVYHVAANANWFYYHQPDWMEFHILQKTTVGGPDSNAFWSGFSRMEHGPNEALLKRMMPSILTRFASSDRVEHNLVRYLLSGWGSRHHDQMVTDTELRDVLILGDNELRISVLRCLGKWASEMAEWQVMLIPFIRKVWPRQRTVQTPQVSAALVRFASKFPNELATLLEFVNNRLVNLSAHDNLHLDCNIADLDEAGRQALISALERLLPDDRTLWPYQSKKIIAELAVWNSNNDKTLMKLISRAAEREY